MCAMGDDAAGATVSQATTRPILPSADLRATAEFYFAFGFGVVGVWPDEYLILSGPDGIELHFWLDADVTRWTNDVSCWIGYPDPAAVHARFAAWSRVPVPVPGDLRPVTASEQVVEFQLIDVHGNLLRLGSPAQVTAAALEYRQAGKYARIERERRFLLAGPPDLGLVTETVRITDRYLDGTRLRVRSVQGPDAGERSFKLTQKIPADHPGDLSHGVQGLITNTYLSEREFRVISMLPGAVLAKTRYSVPPFGVDVFEGELAGLVLAEAEFETDDDCSAFEPPLDGRVRIIAEVTADPRFSGGQLALTTARDLAAALDEFGLVAG